MTCERIRHCRFKAARSTSKSAARLDYPKRSRQRSHEPHDWALVTGNTKRAAEATQMLIDSSHPDWSSSGLLQPSVVNASNLFTIDQSYIKRVIGKLSSATMKQIDECLKVVLEIS